MEEFAPGATMQILSFQLAEDVFAVDVTKVREVLDLPAITRVPKAPPHRLGVINLRGSVVPVVDLRVRFGMEPAERTVDSCVIVFEVMIGSETVVAGALTDSVLEVVEIGLEKVGPPSRLGTGLKGEFIKGIIVGNGHFSVLLDIDRIFANEGLRPPNRENPTGEADKLRQAASTTPA